MVRMASPSISATRKPVAPGRAARSAAMRWKSSPSTVKPGNPQARHALVGGAPTSSLTVAVPFSNRSRSVPERPSADCAELDAYRLPILCDEAPGDLRKPGLWNLSLEHGCEIVVKCNVSRDNIGQLRGPALERGGRRSVCSAAVCADVDVRQQRSTAPQSRRASGDTLLRAYQASIAASSSFAAFAWMN